MSACKTLAQVRKLLGVNVQINIAEQQVNEADPLLHIWKTFCAKLRGHIRYYGVSFNSTAVWQFVWQAVRILFRWLNRRSQRTSFTWERFLQFLRSHPHPAVKVHHSLF